MSDSVTGFCDCVAETSLLTVTGCVMMSGIL